MAELPQTTYLKSLLTSAENIKKRQSTLDLLTKRRESLVSSPKLDIIKTAITPKKQAVIETGIRPIQKYGNVTELAAKATAYNPFANKGTQQPFSQFGTEKTYTTSQNTAASDLYTYCVNGGAGCTTNATTMGDRVFDFAARRANISNRLNEVTTLIDPYITSINSTYFTGGQLNVKPEWLSVADWQKWQDAYSGMESLKTSRRNNQDSYIKTGNISYLTEFTRLNEQMKGYLSTMNSLIPATVTTAGQNVTGIQNLQKSTISSLEAQRRNTLGGKSRTENVRVESPDVQSISKEIATQRAKRVSDFETIKKKAPVFTERPR